MRTRPLGEMQAVMSMYRRALLAEVEGFPSTRTVSAEQVKLADTALETAIHRRWSRMNDPEMAARVYADEARADPKELCTVSTIAMRAVMDLKDPMRSWALVNFAKEMSR